MRKSWCSIGFLLIILGIPVYSGLHRPQRRRAFPENITHRNPCANASTSIPKSTRGDICYEVLSTLQQCPSTTKKCSAGATETTSTERRTSTSTSTSTSTAKSTTDLVTKKSSSIKSETTTIDSDSEEAIILEAWKKIFNKLKGLETITTVVGTKPTIAGKFGLAPEYLTTAEDPESRPVPTLPDHRSRTKTTTTESGTTTTGISEKEKDKSCLRSEEEEEDEEINGRSTTPTTKQFDVWNEITRAWTPEKTKPPTRYQGYKEVVESRETTVTDICMEQEMMPLKPTQKSLWLHKVNLKRELGTKRQNNPHRFDVIAPSLTSNIATRTGLVKSVPPPLALETVMSSRRNPNCIKRNVEDNWPSIPEWYGITPQICSVDKSTKLNFKQEMPQPTISLRPASYHKFQRIHR